VNLLDWLLILLTLAYGVSGYWQGFVTGASATGGLLLGGLLGIVVIPHLLGSMEPSVGVSLIALVTVLVTASVGQALGAYGGGWIRGHITWEPARAIDAVGGAILSMVAVLVVCWAIGYAVSGARMPAIAEEVRESSVLGQVDDVMPNAADEALSAFNEVVASDLFPRYIEPFASERIPEVDAPTAVILRRPGVEAAEESVVKILGDAEECNRSVEGSGFAYGPERVMTNAHVVAGVTDPTVEADGSTFDAEVVVYDPELDVAVLEVDGLDVPALEFDTGGDAGDTAAVLGYPEDGPYDAQPARIRAEQNLRSPDIYNDGTVEREVFSIRSLVRSGNSGGPLVSRGGDVYGVVFAASLSDDDTGYVLTAEQVAEDADLGLEATGEVSTGDCA
jgi:S1-C subfamily serine protease